MNYDKKLPCENKLPIGQDKFQDFAMDGYTVRLPSFHALFARELGKGNLSRGIRMAIEQMCKIGKENKKIEGEKSSIAIAVRYNEID